MSKITFKLVRSFSIGFTIYSPKLNGICFDIYFGCFHASYWNRPCKKFISFNNHWSG